MSVNEKVRRKRILARIFGTLGVSFFGPLLSGNVAESMFDVGLSFEETLIIAAIAAVFQTGYTLSLEVRSYGERKSVSNS